jgi:hypothetical protein
MVLLGIYFVLSHTVSHSSLKQKASNGICIKTACIKITESDGGSYQLNDFRFAPGKCIDFISMPDNVMHHFCGVYKLDWIGPASSTGSVQR